MEVRQKHLSKLLSDVLPCDAPTEVFGPAEVPIGCGGRALLAVGGEKVVIHIYDHEGRLRRRGSLDWTDAAIRAADSEIRHVVSGALARSLPRPAKAAA